MDEQVEKTHEEEVEFYNAFLYLANYHIKKGQYDDAYSYAFKCIEFDEVKAFTTHCTTIICCFSDKRTR